ncbi:peptidoglycan-binding protein [Fictibacillus iocasae]|uniref:Peptidoglycan-binding protein n=1 Tax=Fictibacillus iocasae TaxID=2715437 RepID=A0ABW2NNE0_9BACL
MRKKKVIKRFIISSTFAGAFLAVPLIGEAALGDQTLTLGTSHPDVKELQKQLKEKGYFHEETTNYFGPVTQKALKEFQQKNGLTADGIAGKQTYSVLLAKKSAPTPPTYENKQPEVKPLLKMGSTGDAVKQLQNNLRVLGLFTYPKTTGYYGSVTAEAVRKFQLQHKLKATAVVDTVTASKIAAEVKKKTTLNTGQKPPAPKPVPAPMKPAQPPAPAPQPATLELKLGMQNADVSKLQSQLKTLGFYTYPTITGYYGPITAEAVKSFQKFHKLPVTGIVTKEVRDRITAEETKKLGSTPSVPPVSQELAINVIANAAELMGTPYVWGGSTTAGFDCSGFIQYVFAKEGVKLPRTVGQMWNAVAKVDTPEVGDLVFFETYQPGASHLGIYLGNDQFVHSGSNTGVTISSMNSKYWSERYIGAGRVIQ